MNKRYIRDYAEKLRWQAARDYFAEQGSLKGKCLHHIDTTLKYSNPCRYHMWLPQDLTVMTTAAHRALHMKMENKKGSKVRSAEYRANISASQLAKKCKKGNYTVTLERGDERLTFDSFKEAATHLGCTPQMLSQCSRHRANRHTRYNHTACGWKVSVAIKEAA